MSDNGKSEALDLARSALPMFEEEDTKKSLYLSYRLSNFSRFQSVELSSIHRKTLARWTEADPNFAYIDGEGIGEMRKQLANEFLDMQFTRNFHLVLQKDFKILYKDAINQQLSPNESEYLNKIRQHYTPQSLAMMKQLLGGGTVEQPFDFTKLTISIRREQIDMVQEKHSL